MSNVLDLNEQDQIVDPQTGLPSHNFLRYLLDRGGLLSGKAEQTLVLTAGAGLTGGGDLSEDRTFDIGAGTGIMIVTGKPV